jgi:hypothetical protein
VGGYYYYASSKNRMQDVDWTDPTQDRQQWQAVMNTVLKHRVPQNGRNFLSS